MSAGDEKSGLPESAELRRRIDEKRMSKIKFGAPPKI